MHKSNAYLQIIDNKWQRIILTLFSIKNNTYTYMFLNVEIAFDEY